MPNRHSSSRLFVPYESNDDLAGTWCQDPAVNPARICFLESSSIRGVCYKFTQNLQVQKVQNRQLTQHQTQASETDYNEVIKHMPKLKSSITRRSNTAAVTDITGVHPKRHDYMYK
jgi:hypothetical protein